MAIELPSDSTPDSRLLESLHDEHECDYITMFATGNTNLLTETAIYGNNTTKEALTAPPEVQTPIQTIQKATNVPSDGKMLVSVMWVRRAEHD